MSGWVIVRRQPSTAVWGGVTGPAPAAVPGLPSSGWVIVRRQPSTAVWGGIAAVSNVLPPPALVVMADDGDAPWHIRIRRRRT